MHEKGYVKESEGNLSVRCPGGRSFYITPTGFHKGELRAMDILEIGLHGKRSGGFREPSSDLEIHLSLYRTYPWVGAVLHAHSPRAVELAGSGTFSGSSPECPPIVSREEDIPDAISKAGSVLLKNHGIYAAGKNLKEAFERLERVENPRNLS